MYPADWVPYILHFVALGTILFYFVEERDDWSSCGASLSDRWLLDSCEMQVAVITHAWHQRLSMGYL